MAAAKNTTLFFIWSSLSENIQPSDTQYFYFSFDVCQFWLDWLKLLTYLISLFYCGIIRLVEILYLFIKRSYLCEYLIRKCRGWWHMVSESKKVQPGTPCLSGHILHLLHQSLSAVLLNCRPCWKAEFSFLMINSFFKHTFPIISSYIIIIYSTSSGKCIASL